jgi:poly-gamma-glutamate synthesis protein (capsule biosynthesis protein)
MRNKFLSTIIAILPFFCFAQNQDTTSLSLLFIGDIMNHDTQIEAAYDSTSTIFDYDTTFAYIKGIISDADIAIANLEVTFAGKPYKGYPRFSAPDEMAFAIRNSGIDCLVMANNHANDTGKEGFERTHQVLENLGFPHTGTFVDSLEKGQNHPLYLEKNGIKIALLNYTYGTNGNEAVFPNSVNYINDSLILLDIDRAKKENPDKIIMFMHWGVEYVTEPEKEFVELTNKMFMQGADIIIGSHPHVLRRMERIETPGKPDKIVVYSLGNFVSNQRTRPRDGGTMFKLTLNKSGDHTDIGEAGYILTWVYAPRIAGDKSFYILPLSEFEYQPGFFIYGAYDKMRIYSGFARGLLDSENKNIPEYIFDPIGKKWELESTVQEIKD